MSKSSNKIKHEDLIMKKAMEVFSEDGIAALGIEGKVKEVGSTEIVVLEAKNFSMDYILDPKCPENFQWQALS